MSHLLYLIYGECFWNFAMLAVGENLSIFEKQCVHTLQFLKSINVQIQALTDFQSEKRIFFAKI